MRGFLDFAALRKPEIPVFQNHRPQRHQQNPQRDEHSFPLHFRVRRRGLQGKWCHPLQTVLGLGFVLKHRYGSLLEFVTGSRIAE